METTKQQEKDIRGIRDCEKSLQERFKRELTTDEFFIIAYCKGFYKEF